MQRVRCICDSVLFLSWYTLSWIYVVNYLSSWVGPFLKITHGCCKGTSLLLGEAWSPSCLCIDCCNSYTGCFYWPLPRTEWSEEIFHPYQPCNRAEVSYSTFTSARPVRMAFLRLLNGCWLRLDIYNPLPGQPMKYLHERKGSDLRP